MATSTNCAFGTHLGSKTLEERGDTLLGDHLADNGSTADVGAKVGVLDTGLDDVEGSGNSDRGDGTGNRGNEVWSVSDGFL